MGGRRANPSGRGQRIVGYGTPILSRIQWGARPRVCSSTNITPEGTTVHYGGPSPWGSNVDRSTAERFRTTASHDRCASILRAWQAYHLDTQGWCDLAYSSAVCPHGFRYEGRGPGFRTGAQGTNDGNQRSYAVVYIAGAGDPLTEAAKRAYLDEADRLRRLRWGHRDWKPTSCPGDPVYAWRQAGFPRPAGATVPPSPLPTLPPQPVGYRMPPTIRRGSAPRSPTRKLQGLLLAHGYTLPGPNCGLDGSFGSGTERVVRQFQHSHSIVVTGVVDARTWRALIEQ